MPGFAHPTIAYMDKHAVESRMPVMASPKPDLGIVSTVITSATTVNTVNVLAMSHQCGPTIHVGVKCAGSSLIRHRSPKFARLRCTTWTLPCAFMH